MNKGEIIEFVSFSAVLMNSLGEGVPVRITAKLKDIDIVSRDNIDSFDVEKNFLNLRDVDLDDIY